MTNPETGLPFLPEGYFWRVTRGTASKYVYVQIRKRRLIGSACVADSILSKGEVTAAKIRERAGFALKDFDPDHNFRAFVGDYPPKKLGGA